MADATDELLKLRDERERYRDLWLRASDEAEALDKKLAELDEQLEHARDLEDAAWEVAAGWKEYVDIAWSALDEERQARDALIRLEVDRLVGREPKPRGRPPSWSPDAEAEVERLHRAGASIRQISAELGSSKSQIQRVVARVRHQQAEAAERARLAAIADGRARHSARPAWPGGQQRPPAGLRREPRRARAGISPQPAVAASPIKQG